MAMQQSSKGASGSGSSPALSDEQAEQFAASFTPAWDADDGVGDTTSGTPDATVSNTQVMDRADLAKAAEAPPIVGTPAIIFNAKSTMIGVPPPAQLAARPATPSPVSVPPAAVSAEVVEPENVLEVVSAPPPAPAPAAPVHKNQGMHTQVMQNRPTGPGPAPAVTSGAATIASRPPAERIAAAAADPFRSGASSADESDAFPKRSNKTVIFVIAGLAVAAGLGLFLKFALGGDDAPKAPPSEMVTGPAVTTAEIPPPPPKEETPPAATTAAVTAAKTADPAPSPLATPPHAAVEPPAAALPVAAAPRAAAPPPRNEPRQPQRGALPPPPAAAAPPPPPAATPKSAPKAPNGGIVRDNPF